MSVFSALHAGRVHPRRVEVLAKHVAELLPPCQKLVDVGCGDGLLAHRLGELRPEIVCEGIDVLVRGQTHIPVKQFDGEHLPFEDNAVDAVMMIDVLHHTADPRVLLRESARVARKAVVLKDHTREGLLAGSTLAFMDHFANTRHGISPPQGYWRYSEWKAAFEDLGLGVETWRDRLAIYPRPADWIFGRGLHFLAVLSPSVPR